MKNTLPIGPTLENSVGDIYFVLFRHKRKILFLAAAGIVAAILYYLLSPPLYQSEAKLFIRYVLDARSPNTTPTNTREVSSAESSGSIINSEIQILTSIDVAREAAARIGPQKILAGFGGGDDLAEAANVIKTHLTVTAPNGSSVIDIVFSHSDSAVVRPVLDEIITNYLEKHLEVHQASGASDDFLMENMGRLRSQILRTENELRSAKTSAGFVSAEQAEHFYGEQIAKIRAELYQDGAELKPGPAETNALLPAKAEISAGQLEDFQEVCTRLQFTRQLEYTYLTQDGYTEGNTLVKAARARIDELTKRKRNLEEEFPALASVTFPPPDVSSPTSSSLAIVPPAIPLPTEINVLKRQLVQIQNDAAGVDDAESRISDLQLEKQVEDRNYQSYAASLEEARINETLGAGGLSNISLIQAPSPLFKDSSEKYKVMRMMIAAGIISGIFLAFLIEFYFDTSVKRAVEVESRLKIPLFLSIPDVSQNPDRYLAVAGAAERKRIDNHSSNDANGNSENGNGVIASGANGNGGMRNNSSGTGGFLNPFCDTLRDRLTAYFETINLTCKPKLVAVTGTDRGSGVSTIAAGLAASLSETGNGRVLLVDMNRERGAAQQFFRGETDCQLDDALAYEKRDTARVQENLYVVTEGAAENLKRILPSRFALLMPKLKASDYDYIIFDMPPVSQTSVTPRLARLMDMTLLVILSEKTDRYVVQEANALLTSAQATVGAVLNKTRRYLPDLLHRKSLGDV